MTTLDLSKATVRSRLPPRNDPHWRVVDKRQAIGFRKTESGAESWIARWREPGGGDKHYHKLGSVEELPTFTLAKREAEAWWEQMESGSTRRPTRGTVRSALAVYVWKKLRGRGRLSTARDSIARFNLTVPRNGKFGQMRLEELTLEDSEKWQQGLRKGRSNRSVNRQVRAVVAALNFATNKAGHIGNRKAWTLEALAESPEFGAKPRTYLRKGKETTDEGPKARVFLTMEQRERLIDAASPALAAFLTGLNHTGARPGELAAAMVKDFNPQAANVTLLHRKGKGAKVKVRAVELSDVGVEFFKQQAAGKSREAPLLSNESGEHWTDQQWCAGIERAVEDAGEMPAGTSAYAFRHTRASDLLQGTGLVVVAFDPTSVAVQLGTSVEIIQKHYFHLISTSFRAKLNAVKEMAK